MWLFSSSCRGFVTYSEIIIYPSLEKWKPQWPLENVVKAGTGAHADLVPVCPQVGGGGPPLPGTRRCFLVSRYHRGSLHASRLLHKDSVGIPGTFKILCLGHWLIGLQLSSESTLRGQLVSMTAAV